MSKDFSAEIDNLNLVYKWSLKSQISDLEAFVAKSLHIPMMAVGSGGSLTAAHIAVLLHNEAGMIGEALTPLKLLTSGNHIANSSVLLLSAGGRNPDILSAFRFAVSLEPSQLLALAQRGKSPLADLSSQYSFTGYLGLDLPTGKDGFLATNSLLSCITILIRAYNSVRSHPYQLLQEFPQTEQLYAELGAQSVEIEKRDTWMVLYGGWGLPVAVDLESKCSEASLKNIQPIDYRNVAHGRHIWLSQRSTTTGIVAIITPDEEVLAERTLALLPKSIPVLRLVSSLSGPSGSLELIIKAMHLIQVISKFKGVNPGRPTVPDFGRRLFHLRIPQKQLPSKKTTESQQTYAIIRKSRCPIAQLSSVETEYWQGAYKRFTQNLECARFGAVVFDYDGTLCADSDRFTGPRQHIVEELLRLLEQNILIGISTGRGQSVRLDLQRLIPKRYWSRILIGYYNGSDVGLLTDNSHPIKIGPLNPTLEEIRIRLHEHQILSQISTQEIRPNQITIEPNHAGLRVTVKAMVIDCITKIKQQGLQLLESSHSLDVVAPNITKVSLVNACKETLFVNDSGKDVLCIGDQGNWPGNDYDLLATPYSLSVDVVSIDASSCWRLTAPGHRGTQATFSYLRAMEIEKEGMLAFSCRKAYNPAISSR